MTDLVITPATATTRRRLGPIAWLVLEELLLGADPGDGTDGTALPCAVSVRELAGRLELDKDTIARAVRRLIDAGLIARGQARAAGGTFARTTYLVEVPDGLRLVPPGPVTSAAPSPSRTTTPPTAITATTRTVPTRASVQLSLLDG